MNRMAIIFTLLLVVPTLSWSYDDSDVHPFINEMAAYQSSVLKNWLREYGFDDPIDVLGKEVAGHSIKKWLRQGGTDEDGTSDSKTVDIVQGRYLRHFHDPLYPWADAGLAAFSSNLVWAQKQVSLLSGDFSWPAAREHYYQALTTWEEPEFAATFLTLGHLMHLVADMAVPAHVRNDSHPGVPGPPTWKSDFYEKWATTRYEKWENEEKPAGNNQFISKYFTGLPVDLSIFSHARPENSDETNLAPDPISALWDQNRYTMVQDNPWVTRTGASPDGLADIGLAEYTNANFFSQDTIFSYEHPSEDEAYFKGALSVGDVVFHDLSVSVLEPVLAEDAKTDLRLYAYADDGQGEYHLASLGYFYEEIPYVQGVSRMYRNYTLDETVFSDYAARLIPRAVGYSTALLDYFFRGRIEMRVLPEWLLVARREYEGGNVWHDNANKGLSRIGIMARNASLSVDGAPESMNDGSIELVVSTDRYLLRCPQPVNTSAKSIGVSEQLFIFDISQLPIEMPADGSKLAVDLYLIYRGRLGQESDGIAVGHQRVYLSNNMTVSLPPEGAYAKSETMPWELADPKNQGFDTITLMVHDDIAVSHGDLHLAATYRVAEVSPFQDNAPAPDGPYRVSLGTVYGATVPTLAGNNGKPVRFSFNLDQPIPMYATDLRLHLYMEEPPGVQNSYDTGFKDTSEPHIFAVMNYSDRSASECYYMHQSELFIKPSISSQYESPIPLTVPPLHPETAWRVAVLSDYVVTWEHGAFRFEPSSYCNDSPETMYNSGQSMTDAVSKNQGDYFAGDVCRSGSPCYGYIVSGPPYFNGPYYFNGIPYGSGFDYFR